MDAETQTSPSSFRTLARIDIESIADVWDDGVVICTPSCLGTNDKPTQTELITGDFFEMARYLLWSEYVPERAFWKEQERMLGEMDKHD